MLGAASTSFPTAPPLSRSLRARAAFLRRASASSLPRRPSLTPSFIPAASTSGGGGGAMAGLLNSLKSALGGGGAPGGGGGVGGGGGGGNNTPANAVSAFADTAPSWAALQALVDAQRAALGVPEPDFDNGPTNPRSLLRTFGTDPTTTPPRVTLYRDHAAWCPYCAKVWLQLEAKRIPYKVVKINMRCYGNKPPEYMSRVPSGLLPALELDGVLHTDSAVIAQVLEAAFPDNTPLLPPPDDAPATARHAALMRLERQLFSDWLGWLCQGGGHEGRRAAFHRTLGLVEGALGTGAPGGGPFFMGARPALADCVFAPFLERISASIPYYKGDALRGDRAAYPALNAWFDAMEAWPVYLGTKSDFYTHVHDLPPQLGGCAAHGSPSQAAMAGDIDGTDGASWSLPLAPLASAGPAAEWWPGEDPPADRLRAAARLVENARGVTRFAARGPAPPGRPAVSAPLSDPYARADEAAIPAIDAALRLVAASLLSGPEAVDVRLVGSGGGGGAAPPSPPSSPLDGALAASGLAYLRDRVGVPRDLPLPAARQLRAHLNWFVGAVGGDVNVKR